MKKVWPPVITLLGLLALWQLLVSVLQVEKWLLPGPLDIVRDMLDNGDRLWMHTLSTVQIALIGLVAGVGLGLIISVVLHILPIVRSGLYPLLVLSQNIPIIALAPLLVIWFGFGVLPKVMVITLVCFFPIAVSVLDGLRQTDRTLLSYMQMVGASRRDIFFKLELPHALPYLFAGLKISATYSVMGAVVAEWLGSQSGLGMYMDVSASAFRTASVFSAIVMVVALSLGLFALVVWLEKLVIRWRPKDER